MKFALIIPDGAADEPQPTLDGKTPLQAAETPNMDTVALAGIVGQTDNVPESMPSGSDVGTMSLFGYDPLKFHTGRAPLEAAAQGIELGPNDWAIRCNLVTMQDGKMISFTAGQCPNDLGSELMTALQQELGSDQWEFHTGVSYRNLVVYRGTQSGLPPFDHTTQTVPPHDITDQMVAEFLPKGRGAEELNRLMTASEAIFKGNASNQQRANSGEHAPTNIWLWGQGSRPALEPFADRFGVKGSVITAVDLLRGIGRLIDWDVIEVEGATGYLDTDYAAKGRAAIEALKGDIDFIVVHVEATDEASHEGDVEEKLKALHRIDQDIVGPVHEHLRQQGDYRLLISPDHPTFLRTKTHSHGYVPFTICGSDVSADERPSYDEVSASSGHTIDRGHQLMNFFFREVGSVSP